MCFTSTLGIGIDYYYEVDIANQSNLTTSGTNYSVQNETDKSIDESDVDDERNEQVKVFYYVTKVTTESTTQKHNVSFLHSINSNTQEMLLNENNFSSKPILDIFNEYEYIYDDEKYQMRNGEFVTEEKKEGRNPRIYYSRNDTRKMKKNKSDIVKLKLLDYYTLEPAAAYVTLKDDKYIEANGSIWYVPQDIPCWELPILYGELGHKEQISDVFSIHRGYLKNVLHHNKKNKISRKDGYSPGTQMFNKWCGIEPCYGDHTLCLFPDKTISIFCEKGYTVKTPTISEQIALVNTVNSMRNRIASGESIRYSHLPQAANMMQITYDFDLEKMAQAWLSQCLPGPAPCSALEGNYVSELECMKYMQKCCLNSYNTDTDW